MKDGRLNPFAGPIYDSQGRKDVARSQTLTHEELRKMDWFFEGVELLNDEGKSVQIQFWCGSVNGGVPFQRTPGRPFTYNL